MTDDQRAAISRQILNSSADQAERMGDAVTAAELRTQAEQVTGAADVQSGDAASE